MHGYSGFRRMSEGAARFGALQAAGSTVASLAALTACFTLWFRTTNATIPALAYLLVVLAAATFGGLRVGIAGSAVAVLLLNYFFMAPVGTLLISDPQNWVTLAVMLAVSVIGSQLSASARAQAHAASARRDELGRLFDLSRDILTSRETEDAHARLARAIVQRFDLSYAAVCLPTASGWQVHEAGEGVRLLPHEQLEEVLRAAQQASATESGRQPSGRHTIHAQHGLPAHVMPLRVAGRPVGLLAIAGRSIEEETLDALIGLAAIAVERVQFLGEREAAELARHAAELKSSLLDSMAHDLKTPLTAIRVAASNLQADWATADDHRTQSDIVLDEVARLSELFDHMLQMARIETKAVVPAAEWVTPGEIVDAALGEVRRQLSGRRLVVTSDDAHAVHVDPRLTSSALAHLVENAVQYSESGSTVTVSAAVAENGLTLSVDDEGPGLSKAEIGHVFDRYFRGRAGAARPAGAGMGLAVVRGLVEAQGGAVSATNREERGSRFTIRIPAASRTVPSSDDEP